MPTDSLSRSCRAEVALYTAFAALAAFAAWGPHIAQGAHAHAFADQRTLWGVPHAMDVLTNLPFAIFGAMGLWRLCQWLQRCPRAPSSGAGDGSATTATAAMGATFFLGLLLTAAGSALYHWQPHEITLLADRAGMLVAFAGVLGLAVATRIGTRAAWVTAAAVLAGGWLALRQWGVAGQLLPWAVVQGGGMCLIAVLAVRPVLPGRLPVPLAALIGWYALAKLLEAGDHAVWQASGGMVAGHSLKHVAAALAAWPVLAAFQRPLGPAGGAGYWARCRRTAWRGRPRPAAPQAPGRGTIAADPPPPPSPSQTGAQA